MSSQIALPIGMETSSHPLVFCKAKFGVSILPGKQRTGSRGGVRWNCSSIFSGKGTVRTLDQDSVGHSTSSGNGGDEEDAKLADSKVAKPGVQRYLLAIEYDGTRFSGSQWQPNRRTVVGVLQDAFQNFIGQPVPVFCSSRTDAGVHALSNVCHADVQRISKRRPGEVLPPHDPGVVRKAVNHFLQKNEGDIRVIDVRCVSAVFHARFNAQHRTYYYRLLSGPGSLSLFERGRAWHISQELDILSMQVMSLPLPVISEFYLKDILFLLQRACDLLVGSHDFSSFRAARCQAKSPVKTLDELHISEVVSPIQFPLSIEREENSTKQGLVEDGADYESASISCFNHDSFDYSMLKNTTSQTFGQKRDHRCIVITATARSFLYHQVRLLVGVLKSVGSQSLTIDDVQRILDAKTVTACPMAPACGLYLGHVKYDLP